jgi:hypothetical protein
VPRSTRISSFGRHFVGFVAARPTLRFAAPPSARIFTHFF